MADTITIKVLRRDGPTAPSRWEAFSMPYRPNLNVISCLMEIRRRPVTVEGKATTPVAWEQNCLENVCGSCSMLINGRPMQACATLIDNIGRSFSLAPLTKFPVVRDLMVDRQRMFEALKDVKAWVPVDGTYDLGPGPKMSDETRALRYALSLCMTCGCCMEACPQYQQDAAFVGPAPVGQSYLFLLHPTGRLHQDERRHTLMKPGGINDCGNAQNCERVCPRKVPLLDAIAGIYRETTKQWFKDLFGK